MATENTSNSHRKIKEILWRGHNTFFQRELRVNKIFKVAHYIQLVIILSYQLSMGYHVGKYILRINIKIHLPLNPTHRTLQLETKTNCLVLIYFKLLYMLDKICLTGKLQDTRLVLFNGGREGGEEGF